MPYDELRERLAAGTADPGHAVAFPDGSVDVYYDLFRGRTTALESRADLAAFVAEPSTSSLRMRERDREAGGQSVNAARQLHALGAPVTLFGHLDAPAFDELPFASHSMGEPAVVRAFDLADDDLLLCEQSADLASWEFDALAAVDGAVAALEAADVVCAMNWVSSPAASAAYRDLAALDLDDPVVVVDPGDVTGCSDGELRELGAALGALEASARVVLSTNAAETERVAAAVHEETGSSAVRVRALRSRLDVTAVVSHERDRAVAGTPDGLWQVPNVDAPQVTRRTGGGDRFGAALAVARTAGLDWRVSLAAANACASHFVATGESATWAALESFLDEVALPD